MNRPDIKALEAMRALRSRDSATRWARPSALFGGALVAGGSFAPWASYFFGYPGKVTLGGFPGGARIFTLLLAVPAVVVLADIPGRRRAGLAAGLGALAVSGFNFIAIAHDGNGLVALAWGMWITVIGAALFAAGMALLPDDRALPEKWPALAAPIELLLIALALGALMFTVVRGLDIDESSRFLSFLVFVAFAATVVQRLGLFTLLQQTFERRRTIALTAALVTAVAFPFTQGGNAYWIRVFASIGVFAAAAIGLNVVVGLAGLLDLGYIAFFGVGAYVGAMFANAGVTHVHIHLPFAVTILLGAMTSAAFGVLIGAPTLRLRGDYLAIVTLGFGEIFRIVVNQWDGLTGGPNGISSIPDLKAGGLDLGESHKVLGISLPYFANYYFLEIIVLILVVLIFTRLNDSRIGRAWVAIREDETAAAAMGVNTVRYKLLAFAIGAFLAGAAGTVNAHIGKQVSPDSYTFLESILLLSAVVLGGMGTVGGALLGSSALFVIPEKLRSFQDKRLMLFGAALILMMRFRPEGIIPSRRRQRELHSGGTPGAMDAPPGSPLGSGTS